jgi:Tfp pilus assembly protein PilN
MIQFNLLPDVKLEYLKAESTKRMVIMVSILASAAALAIFLVLLFTVDVVQKKNINDLTRDIGTYGNQLKDTPDLAKILTVQSQLSSLTQLHDAKPTTSRVFKFVNQLTPKTAGITKLDVDFTANTMDISGHADSLDTVNKFVDALKYTKYSTSANPDTTSGAFSAVVLSNFGRDAQGANFEVTLSFDPLIFSNANDVTLTVDSSAATAQTTSAILFGGNR